MPSDSSRVAEMLAALASRGYAAAGPGFRTGRSDRVTMPLISPTGRPVVAKMFSSGSAAAYANMQELWRSSFGARRQPPGLPEPIEHLPDLSVLIMERLEGRPWIELGGRDVGTLREAIHLVAALHASDARPTTRRDAQRLVRSARHRVGWIGERAPNLASSLREVVEALEAAQVPDRELVPCHGEFSARNVLVAENRLALIDWDRLQWADPARDIAYLGAWSWVSALEQGYRQDWSMLEQAAALYDQLRPQAMVGARLGFHVAAGLVRIGVGVAILRPGRAHLVPRLLAEALRQLQ